MTFFMGGSLLGVRRATRRGASGGGSIRIPSPVCGKDKTFNAVLQPGTEPGTKRVLKGYWCVGRAGRWLGGPGGAKRAMGLAPTRFRGVGDCGLSDRLGPGLGRESVDAGQVTLTGGRFGRGPLRVYPVSELILRGAHGGRGVSRRSGGARARMGRRSAAGRGAGVPLVWLYARTIYEVAGLASVLTEAGQRVKTSAAEIETVRRIDRNLALLFWVIAAAGMAGYSLSLGASLWVTPIASAANCRSCACSGFAAGDHALPELPRALHRGPRVARRGFRVPAPRTDHHQPHVGRPISRSGSPSVFSCLDIFSRPCS